MKKKKKSGIELITIERKEQIEKHGRTIESDVLTNSKNQIIHAIMLLVSNIGYKRVIGEILPEDAFMNLKPDDWSSEICFKMINKPEIEQLKIIGAFAAAEIDRLNNIN